VLQALGERCCLACVAWPVGRRDQANRCGACWPDVLVPGDTDAGSVQAIRQAGGVVTARRAATVSAIAPAGVEGVVGTRVPHGRAYRNNAACDLGGRGAREPTEDAAGGGRGAEWDRSAERSCASCVFGSATPD